MLPSDQNLAAAPSIPFQEKNSVPVASGIFVDHDKSSSFSGIVKAAETCSCSWRMR